MKFLVAESELLGLFKICVNCVNEAQGHDNHRKRTFINIILKCDVCTNKRSWNSQPFVSFIPAGNLQLSSTFLFAGAIRSQALRNFEFLKMANTNTDIFYMHQKELPPVNKYTFLEEKSRELL
ncbi:hypothetical protein CHS0354_032405 [Potamilus streckersoni]|uniref:Uncharacterized protein n=1 Tax=Potamilus streckersoni TaxID=2493646 RepID=A0AAE0WCA4_9BIVA|nr:hypothetical protein CHS0354_032405 [Potamilus streckersoni]